MATALQALLRRGAAAQPSLGLLRPPLSPGRYSTPCSPLLAASSAAAGLPDVRRPQLSPAPVPSLLRHFSSKPSKGCAPPPRRRPLTSTEGTPVPRLEQGEEYLVVEDLQKLKKQSGILVKALDTYSKASALLHGDWNDKSVAMFENGLGKALKAVAAYEKALDVFSRALGSRTALSEDILQQLQMLHKELTDYAKVKRQDLNEAQAQFMTLKISKNVTEVDLSTSVLALKKLNRLSKFKGIAIAIGMSLGLAVLISVTGLRL